MATEVKHEYIEELPGRRIVRSPVFEFQQGGLSTLNILEYGEFFLYPTGYPITYVFPKMGNNVEYINIYFQLSFFFTMANFGSGNGARLSANIETWGFNDVPMLFDGRSLQSNYIGNRAKISLNRKSLRNIVFTDMQLQYSLNTGNFIQNDMIQFPELDDPGLNTARCFMTINAEFIY